MKWGIMASGQYTEPIPDIPTLRRIGELVDALPYDSLWVSDHISFKNPIFEGVVALATFAAWTRRVRVGTGVLLLPLRHPSLVAKQLASVDVLAEGRVILGIGVGGEGDADFEAVGVSPHERGRRADEGLDVLRKLWTGRPTTHRGTFFAFDDVVIDPPPVQRDALPVWVGGRSDAALRRVGRSGDAWFAYMVSAERFGSSMTKAREAAEGHGRDPAAITGALMLPTCVDDDRRTARRRLVDHLSRRYGRPIEEHVVDRYCAAGTADDCRARIAEYAQAGLGHVVFMPGGPLSERENEIRTIAKELIDVEAGHA